MMNRKAIDLNEYKFHESSYKKVTDLSYYIFSEEVINYIFSKKSEITLETSNYYCNIISTQYLSDQVISDILKDTKTPRILKLSLIIHQKFSESLIDYSISILPKLKISIEELAANQRIDLSKHPEIQLKKEKGAINKSTYQGRKSLPKIRKILKSIGFTEFSDDGESVLGFISHQNSMFFKNRKSRLINLKSARRMTFLTEKDKLTYVSVRIEDIVYYSPVLGCLLCENNSFNIINKSVYIWRRE